MPEDNERGRPLPAYAPPAPLDVPPQRHVIPIAVWVLAATVCVALLLVGVFYGFQLLIERSLSVVAPGLDSGGYSFDPEPLPEEVELPESLKEVLESEYPAYEIGPAYAAEDRNHPDLPAYDVDLGHESYPTTITVHMWAPSGSTDADAVTEWGTSFPFFTNTEEGHPFSENLIAYVAELSEAQARESAWIGRCRQVGEWDDIQAWACGGYGNISETVYYVDMTTGEWSVERPPALD